MIEATAKLASVHLERREDTGSLSGFCLVAHGKIYGDTRERFADGSCVTTSRVSQIINGVIHTQNSTYEVI
jgi:hypothetical protein